MTVGRFILEREVLKDFLAIQQVVEVLGNFHVVFDGRDAGFDVEMLKGHTDREESLEGLLPYVSIVHGFRVIKSQHDVVVPLAWLGPPEPYPILPVVRSDERNYLFEVQLFTCLVIASVLGLVQRLEH